MDVLAARADSVHRYLAAHDRDTVRDRMEAEAAADDTVRGRLAEALAAQLDALDRLRAQLDRLLAMGDLQEKVAVVRECLDEVYADTRVSVGGG